MGCWVDVVVSGCQLSTNVWLYFILLLIRSLYVSLIVLEDMNDKPLLEKSQI